MAGNVERIAAALRQAFEEGGQASSVVVTADEEKGYYIQFAIDRGKPVVHAEAVSNEYLETPWQLSSRQTEHLVRLGWNLPDKKHANNFHRDWEASDDGSRRRIAQEVMRAFGQVYGIPGSVDLEIEINL